MRIAVIGSGYVGLVSGTCLAHLGHQVICVDLDPERIRAIENATPPFHEPGLSDLLKKVLADGQLTVSTNVVRSVAASDITILAVGTPSRDGDIDLSFVRQAAAEVGQGMRENSAYHVVVVKSTVVPGTTDSVVRSIVQEASGRTAAQFGLCMNPEFLREGSAVSDFLEPDRIVIGQWDEARRPAARRSLRALRLPQDVHDAAQRRDDQVRFEFPAGHLDLVQQRNRHSLRSHPFHRRGRGFGWRPSRPPAFPVLDGGAFPRASSATCGPAADSEGAACPRTLPRCAFRPQAGRSSASARCRARGQQRPSVQTRFPGRIALGTLRGLRSQCSAWRSSRVPTICGTPRRLP